MDGEAQVTLGRIPRGLSYEYCLRISIYNTDRSVLAEIRKGWGGALISSPSRDPRWKPSYALIWTNAAAARFLAEISPYLRVKSRQAAVLHQFVHHLQKCRRRRDRLGHLLPLTSRQLEKREGFYRRIKALNRRGSTGHEQQPRTLAPWKNPQTISPKYLAGFIDAEGCLRLAKGHHPGWNPQYAPRVQVGNTNRAILEDLRKSFGGILTYHPRRVPGWKDGYQLLWAGRAVAPLLLAVKPFLRIKARQARILLQFIGQRKRTHQRRRGRGFVRLPAGVIAYREALLLRMRKLNAKGPSGSNGWH